jgi:hypothetical protein
MGVVIEIFIKYPRGELESSPLVYIVYIYYVLLLLVYTRIGFIFY